MLKILSSYIRFSLDKASDAGIWNAKCLSAIALFGILLTISNTSRLLQQAGKSAALFAGGAAAATALKKRDNLPEISQWRKELQTAHEQQLTDLFAIEQQQQVLDELYESAIAETTLLSTVSTIKATSHAEQVQSQTRIAELETALAAKATLAAEMLTELETEATRTFDQFNAKIVDQEALIKRLHRQVESLSATNAVLTERKTNEIFAHIGSDPLKHHQLVKN